METMSPAPPPRASASPVPAEPISLLFPYGSEKEKWLAVVTAQFNDGNYRTAAGRLIRVEAQPMGSGELTTEILEGRLKAHLTSPASSVFIELGNAKSLSQIGKPLIGRAQNLVLSPVVIAMWKPMAEALGWGKKPLGWAEILDLARDHQGWARYGFPQWGSFKFGHTHPDYSNSGLIALVAEAYAGANKVKGLTLADIQKLSSGTFLQQIESSVVHYGSSTGFFGRKMYTSGPSYLSAAVLYENMVIESYAKSNHLPFPVVAIYPKEGTFWSDHPVGIVDRDWVLPEHREAAEIYIKFLLALKQQQRAMEYGFRPGDPGVRLAAPIDREYGVDPEQPQTTLAVPPAPIIAAVQQLWRKQKKHAHVVLAIDTSGSMLGEEIAAAKAGSKELIAMLGDEDQLSLLSFADKVTWIAKGLKLGSRRAEAVRAVDQLQADGNTALYDGVGAAYRYVTEEHPLPEAISAVVVLSDGADTDSQTKLDQLFDLFRSTHNGAGVRVFAIGYGKFAAKDVLRDIAEATKADCFEGSRENVREVFKKISTFF